MKNKGLIYFLGVISLLLLIVIALSVSYIFNGFKHSPWIIWQAFIYPLVIWVFVYPFYLIYLKSVGKLAKNQKLASSNFMDDSEFKKKFIHKNSSDDYKSSWVVKTNLNKNKELDFYQTKQEGHALVIGSTGSGKTTLLLDANIQLFAKSNDKPSLIISDPKGELFSRHSKLLEENGYEVLTVNLRDHKKSHIWNPLSKAWDLWFSSKNELNREYALNHLAELATTLFPPGKQTNDSFFEESAATVFQFFAIAYLEKAEQNNDFNKERFNITNIISNIHQTTYDELQELIEDLPSDSQAIMVGGSNIKGSERTVSATLQTCVTRMKIYTDPIIKRVTCKTNIKIDISKPQTIFIIVPDESKTKYPFISLFVAETYKELISLASKKLNNRLKRRFYFLLDEFGNIPKIPSMDSMITVARSRNIFFMLLLQNYSQLNEKYSNNIANTIISNCAYEFFLLTADVETAKKFSQKLGQKSLIAKSRSASSNDRGVSSSSSESERTRNLVHPEELMKLKFGEYILCMQREHPIELKLAMLRKWSDFKSGEVKINNPIIKDFNNKHLINFVKDDIEYDDVKFEEFVNPVDEIKK